MRSFVIFFIFMVLLANFSLSEDDWNQQFPSNSPIGRYLHAMAYTGEQKVLLFGGNLSTTLNESGDTWIYDIQNNTWSQSEISGPSAREEHAMAYIGNDNVILFGGDDAEPGHKNDTWIYDLSDNTWTQQNVSTNPPERESHSLAYLGDDKVLLFSGDVSGSGDETWIYDLSDNNWTLKNPETKPPDRHSHSLAYLGDDKVLLFGGNDENPGELGDTWIYDLSENNWTNMNILGPLSRHSHSTAYIGNNQILLFGGTNSEQGQLNDTWIYDLTSNSWTEDINSLAPSARKNSAIAETSMDGTSYLVLFGGLSGSSRNEETWTFGGGDYSLPVELSSFKCTSGNARVNLRWTTESELDNLGFEILRSYEKDGKYKILDSYQSNQSLKGSLNSSSSRTYYFKDRSVINGFTYWYKLVDVDINGTKTEHGPVSATPNASGAELENVESNLPQEFEIYQNFPNPFNPKTTIRFDIPNHGGELHKIRLAIYNSIGHLIAILYDGKISGGQYELKWNAERQPSGVYFLHFQSEAFVKSQKMVLLR